MTVTDTEDPHFDELLAHIEDELAFATSHYNDSYLDRRITARMRRTGSESYASYLDLLAGNDAEAEALLDSLSINVTGFFRNPPMWERLREVLREVASDRRRATIWSAACSDGREPYSLAMLALDDPVIDAGRLSIVGTDISGKALEAARRGVYRTTRTTDIAEELSILADYGEYLDREGDRFSVRDAVRDLVEFGRHDLIRDEPIGEFDVVLCRNLFIYIDPEYKAPILATIDRSLAPDGYLVIGMAETLPTGYRSAYRAVDSRSRIHRRVE